MSWLGHGSHNVDKHLYQPLVNDEDPSDIKQPPVKSSGWGVRTVKNFLAILMFWRSNSQPEEFTPVPEKLAERSVTSDDKPAERSPVNQATHASMVITRYLYPVEDENHPVRFPDFTPAPTSETVVEIKEDVPRYYVKERAFIRISDLAGYGVNMRYLEGVNTLPEDRTDHVFNQQLEAMAWIDEYIQFNGVPEGKQLQKHIANVLLLKQAMLNGTLTDMPDKEYKTLCRSARHCGSLPFNQLKEDANRCQYEFFKVSKPVKEDDTEKSVVQQSFQATTPPKPPKKNPVDSSITRKNGKAAKKALSPRRKILNSKFWHFVGRQTASMEASQQAMDNLNIEMDGNRHSDKHHHDFSLLKRPVICTRKNENAIIAGDFSYLPAERKAHLSHKYMKVAQWFKQNREYVHAERPEFFHGLPAMYMLDEVTLDSLLLLEDMGIGAKVSQSDYDELLKFLGRICVYMQSQGVLYDE